MPPDPYPVPPFTSPVHATVRLPGSKSITNRAMLLAALADGTTTLKGALFSEDTAIMADGLRRLGFPVTEDPARAEIRVAGAGGRFPAREAELFVGLAGTAARFLTALCCLAPEGTFRIDGVPRMRKRPMQSLLDALQALGAEIESDHGHLPLTIRAHGLAGGDVALDATASSQLLSALLMVAPRARQAVNIRLTDRNYRREYVRMTLRMMEQFGQPAAAVDPEELEIRPPVNRPYTALASYPVEPDASAASYFLALPLVTGGRIHLPGLGRASLQGDTAFADRLQQVGAEITYDADGMTCRFEAAAGHGRGISDDFHAISDTFLTLAAITPLLVGETRLTGLAHTRHQETDRVAAMASELRRLGQEVVEEPDALTIRPRALIADRTIETYGDHRFAMSFAILGSHDLRGDGRPWLAIRNPGVCAKTFPDFFAVLEQVRKDSLAAAQRP